LWFENLEEIYMEAVLFEKTKHRKQSVDYQPAFKIRQPQGSENRFRAVDLRAMAQKIDSAVIDNDITMQEIVDEVNAVRKERYEQNRI